jgi:hypothetical protein
VLEVLKGSSLAPLDKLACHRLKALFLEPNYRIYLDQLHKSRAALVLRLAQARGLRSEELCDLQGQLYMLRIVLNLPSEVDQQLQAILTQEERNREYANSTSVRGGRPSQERTN